MLRRLLKQPPYLTLCICAFIFFNPTIAAKDKQQVIRLATTTSTENSGLLDNILPQFEQDIRLPGTCDRRWYRQSVAYGQGRRCGCSIGACTHSRGGIRQFRIWCKPPGGHVQ